MKAYQVLVSLETDNTLEYYGVDGEGKDLQMLVYNFCSALGYDFDVYAEEISDGKYTVVVTNTEGLSYTLYIKGMMTLFDFSCDLQDMLDVLTK